jgi:hypothetical protein
MASIVINYSIPFGATVRIGYRVQNSSSSFTYVNPFPDYTQSPYTITGLPANNNYEVELTTICPNCSGGIFGTPVIYPAITQ